MKGKIMCTLLMVSLVGMNTPAFAAYKKQKKKEKESPIGCGTLESSSDAISVSMFGWGVGLAGAIAILAGVLSQGSSTAHSTSSSSGS